MKTKELNEKWNILWNMAVATITNKAKQRQKKRNISAQGQRNIIILNYSTEILDWIYFIV